MRDLSAELAPIPLVADDPAQVELEFSNDLKMNTTLIIDCANIKVTQAHKALNNRSTDKVKGENVAASDNGAEKQ